MPLSIPFIEEVPRLEQPRPWTASWHEYAVIDRPAPRQHWPPPVRGGSYRSFDDLPGRDMPSTRRQNVLWSSRRDRLIEACGSCPVACGTQITTMAAVSP